MADPPLAADARKAALLFLGLVALLGLPCQLLIAASALDSPLRAYAPVVSALVPYLALLGTTWIRDGRIPDPGLATPPAEPVAVAYAMALVLSGAGYAIAKELAPMIPRVPWEAAEPFGGVGPMILFYLTAGFLLLLARAAVDELSWRGFLLPCLRLAGLPAPALTQALVYALWRYPLVAAVLAARPDPPPYDPRILAANLVAIGILLARERTWSGSIWPGAVFKAAFDLFYLNLIPLFYFATAQSAALVGPAGPVTLALLGPLAFALLVSGRADEPGDDPPRGAAAMA